ncbi:MAG: ribonuclease PH [Candidatus Firestonebacteria bacterium]
MRIDGRSAGELRPVKILRNYIRYSEGSALISCGFTKVICTATVVEEVPPFLRTGQQGWVTAEYGMLPGSTHGRNNREAQKGKASGRTLEIQRLIGRSLRSCVDLKKLGKRSILLDCDVIQADGGTRTASITGSFVALYDAVKFLLRKGLITENPIKDFVAGISVGIVEGRSLLDLCYEEDSKAEVDMNVVMTGSGKYVEIQGTAEKEPYSRKDIDKLLGLAAKGIKEIIALQKKALKS